MDTAGPINYYSFFIKYVYVVLSAATKKAPHALCLLSHTSPILRKLKYSMDSSRQYRLIALVNTAEIQLKRSRLRRCRGHLTGEKREKKYSYNHPRRKRQENILNYFLV